MWKVWNTVAKHCMKRKGQSNPIVKDEIPTIDVDVRLHNLLLKEIIKCPIIVRYIYR